MSGFPPWARWTEDGLDLRLHAQPGARRSGVGAQHGERLRIALRAPPVDGKANDELVRHLAEQLGLRRSQVRLVAGETSREKTVRIACDAAAARDIVGRLGKGAGPGQG